MPLKPSSIDSFKSLYSKHFGIELEDAEAQEKACQLLQYIKLFYRPVKATDKAVLEGFKTA